MLFFINEILRRFRRCFSREAAYQWFVIIVAGLIIRGDHLGVTSVIRDLGLRPECYETMMHFFRSSAYTLDSIAYCWYKIVQEYAPVYRENGRAVLIGDGVKQSKEGRFMPAVKKLHQESEDSSKAEYIFGHMFGGIGVLTHKRSKWFCMPLRFTIQDGLRETADWEGSPHSQESHVVQMIRHGYEAASVSFGKSILTLDRYFLAVSALRTLKELNGDTDLLQIVSKAKKNCTAYEKAPEYTGVGRPRLKGPSVKVGDLFDSERQKFQKADVELYGKVQTAEYYSRDLLWGKGLYMPLRFVLVKLDGVDSIFVSTDLSLSPLTIIRLYSYRSNIESCFRQFKQDLGGFRYHFWTKATPKLNHFQKKGDCSPLSLVKNVSEQSRILATIRATETFVQLSIIAMGVVQMLSLKFSCVFPVHAFRYLRTPSKEIVSEATLMHYLRRHFWRFMAFSPDLPIVQIIREQQDKSGFFPDSMAS